MYRGHRRTRERARALTRRIDQLGTEWRAADAEWRADPTNLRKRERRDRLDREIAATSDQIGNAWQRAAAAELVEIRCARRTLSRRRLFRRSTVRAARPLASRRRASRATVSTGDPAEPPEPDDGDTRRAPRSSEGGAAW